MLNEVTVTYRVYTHNNIKMLFFVEYTSSILYFILFALQLLQFSVMHSKEKDQCVTISRKLEKLVANWVLLMYNMETNNVTLI